MKLTKFNTRDRRRGVNNINQNLSEEQQRLPFSTIKNGINLNNNKLKQSNSKFLLKKLIFFFLLLFF